MTIGNKTIGFIGCGNMGAALIRGIIQKQIVPPERLHASDIDEQKRSTLASELGIQVTDSNDDVMQQADVVVLAVKPQIMPQVLDAIAPRVRPAQVFISIAAGITTRFIEERLGGAGSVIRVMPNTPALIGCGAAALARGAHASDVDLQQACQLFDAVGISVIVDEEQIDAVTGLSGSGPAYFFFMIENMIEAGVEVGLSREVAEALVKQTALGAARMARETENAPAELREMVTSPGGTTFAGLEKLRDGGFPKLIRRCVARATERARELGK